MTTVRLGIANDEEGSRGIWTHKFVGSISSSLVAYSSRSTRDAFWGFGGFSV